jgi:signal transduction histidine kinase
LIQDESAGIEIYREFMKDIDGEVERLNNIITDLLLLVDLDKKKLDVNLKPTYVNFLVGRIIKRLRPLAEEKRMSITFIEKDKLQLRLDSDKIQQSIINILHNAIKYTQEEGAIKVELYKENDFAAIKIEDNGCGIPEDELEFIFERFYRVDKARSRQTGGTGLGLPIAKQIIVLHQGHISVESVVGKGTTFTILLPINS